jgi:hypothetical protein
MPPTSGGSHLLPCDTRARSQNEHGPRAIPWPGAAIAFPDPMAPISRGNSFVDAAVHFVMERHCSRSPQPG